MKRLFTLLLALSFSIGMFAVHRTTNIQPVKIQKIDANSSETTMNILTLTPKKYKEMTGKRMSLKKRIQLKIAKKIIKKRTKRNAEMSVGLYVVLAIIGLGWLAMGINDRFRGSDWLISLVLYLLLWLPGLIYSLIKIGKYY